VKYSKPILLVVIIALALGACATTTETPDPTEVPTETVIVVDEEPEDLLSDPVQTGPTCVVNPAPPDPSEENLAIYTPDPERDWIKGPEDAAITIVEYADFQCPYCSVAAQNLNALLEKYPDDVRIVYRHFPLASIHDKAILATQGAEAAGLNGEEYFWMMHDMLYDMQSLWSNFTIEEFGEWLVNYADSIGLDREQFEADLYSEEIVTFAESTWTEGQAIGLSGTPFLMVNSLYQANPDPATLIAYVELIKLEDRQFSSCPPMTLDMEATYLADIETERGSFVIELYPASSPFAVNSFIYLAENGWFEDITFHRVIPGFVAQTGDPTGTGYGGPGYRFSVETDEDLIFDRAGIVAMANSGPENNGSQFFITYDAAPNLNGSYTIIGEVIDGMDVVENFTPRDPQSGVDLPPGDLLLNITIKKQ
jgi:cyclophilin family peptidyl-prolyl cis-trans isomerase/protein-disulfide isomerase